MAYKAYEYWGRLNIQMGRLRRLSFRLSNNEYDQLVSEADQEGFKNMSRFVRYCVLKRSESVNKKLNRILELLDEAPKPK